MPGPDWQERVTRDSHPAIRIEHELRYRLAAPLIRAAPVWGDLGCGNGLAAASALDGAIEARAVLVDAADHALRHAERQIEAARAVTMRADLASERDVQRVRDALLEGSPAGGCVTCFEVIEHLTSFVPLMDMLVELATAHGFTVALSVPNDAFWSIENPFHHTVWGEGAFEELRRLLPEEHVVAQQFALQGSLMRVDGEDEDRHAIEVPAGSDATPTHFLVGIGPNTTQLAGGAAVTLADLVEERRWQRQRESDVAFLQALEGQLSEWRTYIHELERRLKLPLSGSGDGPA